jgi:hypothetical protein
MRKGTWHGFILGALLILPAPQLASVAGRSRLDVVTHHESEKTSSKGPRHVCSCGVRRRHHTDSAAPLVAPSPEPTSSPTVVADDHYLRDGLKGMAEESQTLMGWALTILAASIVAIVSTSYLRPGSWKARLIYLLFIPGWVCLWFSLHSGNDTSRGYRAAAFAQARPRLLEVGGGMNHDFSKQLRYFEVSIAFFSLWLLGFIVWWVFFQKPGTKQTTE